MTSNFRSSCLGLPISGIVGVYNHTGNPGCPPRFRTHCFPVPVWKVSVKFPASHLRATKMMRCPREVKLHSTHINQRLCRNCQISFYEWSESTSSPSLRTRVVVNSNTAPPTPFTPIETSEKVGSTVIHDSVLYTGLLGCPDPIEGRSIPSVLPIKGRSTPSGLLGLNRVYHGPLPVSASAVWMLHL